MTTMREAWPKEPASSLCSRCWHLCHRYDVDITSSSGRFFSQVRSRRKPRTFLLTEFFYLLRLHVTRGRLFIDAFAVWLEGGFRNLLANATVCSMVNTAWGRLHCAISLQTFLLTFPNTQSQCWNTRLNPSTAGRLHVNKSTKWHRYCDRCDLQVNALRSQCQQPCWPLHSVIHNC